MCKYQPWYRKLQGRQHNLPLLHAIDEYTVGQSVRSLSSIEVALLLAGCRILFHKPRAINACPLGAGWKQSSEIWPLSDKYKSRAKGCTKKTVPLPRVAACCSPLNSAASSSSTVLCAPGLCVWLFLHFLETQSIQPCAT